VKIPGWNINFLTVMNISFLMPKETILKRQSWIFPGFDYSRVGLFNGMYMELNDSTSNFFQMDADFVTWKTV